MLPKCRVPHCFPQPWQDTPTLPFLSSALGLKQQARWSNLSLLCVVECLLSSFTIQSLKSHHGLIYDSGHQAFHAHGVSRSMNPLPFLGIVWFTKKSCEVDVSVKRYSLQMRLFSLEHFIFLSKVTCLIIGRAMPNWRDTIQPITDISLKLPTWCCGERILGMKKSEKRAC